MSHTYPDPGDRLTGERSVPRICLVLDGDICGYEADCECLFCAEHFCDKHIAVKEAPVSDKGHLQLTTVTYICHECEGVRAV